MYHLHKLCSFVFVTLEQPHPVGVISVGTSISIVMNVNCLATLLKQSNRDSNHTYR